MTNEIEQYTNFLFYNTEDGKTSIQVIADAGAETIWTTQKGMAQIFGVEVPAISKHLKNIFDSNELDEKAVVSKMEITADDGKKYLTNCYNLDAIISVGYRELSELNQLVNICLDNAELSVKSGRPISMQGWVEQVNAILSLHGYELLSGKGLCSRANAKAHAKAEYEKFRPMQDARYISDFDKMVEKTLKK